MVGVEWDLDACLTARAAGHHRVHGDVQKMRQMVLLLFLCQYLHASPPCQGFSIAGSGNGRRDGERLLAAILSLRGRFISSDRVQEAMDEFDMLAQDHRSALTMEPLWWIAEARPEYVTLEQVPGVLPIWEAYAEVLRSWGYSVWTGVLTSEMYGVPQSRRRAILMARYGEHDVQPPSPTHSRYHSREPARLDPEVLPWVTMAEALGWGMEARPSMTVTGGGTATGGAEPFGIGARTGMAREMESGRWHQKSNYRDGGPGTAAERGRTIRQLDQPSVAITSKPPSWAPVINNQSGNDYDIAALSASPATVVAGGNLIAFRGATANRMNGSTKSRNDGFRVTVQEAGILQSFPADYPWQGKKGSQQQQVGDAVPPLLAAAIVRALFV